MPTSERGRLFPVFSRQHLDNPIGFLRNLDPRMIRGDSMRLPIFPAPQVIAPSEPIPPAEIVEIRTITLRPSWLIRYSDRLPIWEVGSAEDLELLQGHPDYIRRAEAAIIGTVTATGANEAQSLTYERLQELMDGMGAARARYLHIFNADYAELERRVLAQMQNAPCGAVQREERHSAPLRPIEEWTDEAATVVAEHRKQWLGKQEHLPDAREGPAPVPSVSPIHEMDWNAHEEAGERSEPLASPVDFLPALEK